MTTPRKFKPGKVPALTADILTELRPADLPLPAWVDRESFSIWLAYELERYAEVHAGQQLSKLAREHERQSVEWLRRALKDLGRGDVSRLVHGPGREMPGHALVSCEYHALKAGHDFRSLVRAKALPQLKEVVEAAIPPLERQVAAKEAKRPGRPKVTPRNGLLDAIVRKLEEFPVTEWRDGDAGPRQRKVLKEEAMLLANDILGACGALVVDSAQREGGQITVSKKEVPAIGASGKREHTISKIKRAIRRAQ